MLAISDHFASVCSPVIGSTYDTCGTVTKATIKHLTASELDALFRPGGLYADLDAWLFHSIEMKACGVRRYAMYDWIMASTDRTIMRGAVNPGIKVAKGPSLLEPFIRATQESIVNKDHWKVTNGWSGTDYDALNADLVVYPLTNAQLALGAGADRVIRIESRHGIPLDPAWFRSRDVLFLFNTASDGTMLQGNWKVLASASNANMTYADVLVTHQMAGTTQPYDAAPTSAYLIPGVNNVHDFEVWCKNPPNLTNKKIVLFFYQTMRQARCIDEQYDLVYQRLFDSNPAFAEFEALTTAQRNAEDELDYQKRFVNSFFYQVPLQYQDKDNWPSLEPIYTIPGSVLDPTGATGSPQLIARRANFSGVREQLRVCDRVKDLKKQPLNWYEFLDHNYNIKRARETHGRRVTDIDWWTNSTMLPYIEAAYLEYIDTIYGGKQQYNIMKGQVNEMGQVYDSYKVQRPSGININFIIDEFFDDLYDENDSAGRPTVGNLLLSLDIGKPSAKGGGTIYWAQIAANRREYKTADIQELAKFDSTYRCVMEVSHQRQVLTSETGTPIVECPLMSTWIENMAVAKPVTTGRTLDGLADYAGYQNLY